MSKSYRIMYYPTATEDIVNILDYISIDDPSSANNLIDKINTSIGSLSLFPFKGTVPKDSHLKSKGYRMLKVGSYIVFYLVNESSEVVELMRVVSSRQDYRTFL